MSKMVRPFAVTDSSLVSTNATETVTAWSATTVYAAGDRVLDNTTHRIHESISGERVTATMTIASPCVVTRAAHGKANGTPVAFTTTGALPTGITAGTVYYVVSAAADTFQVAATVGGAAINTSGSQSGVHSATFNPNKNVAVTDTDHWLDVGPDNRYAMFDNLNYTQTTYAGELEVVVDVPGRIDSVAVLNAQATSVTILAEDSLGGEIYNETHSLVDFTPITDWWAYFFEELTFATDLVVTDIPMRAGMLVTTTLHGAATACGIFVIGLSRYIGEPVVGTRVGIDDFSRTDRDDFGNFTGIVQRPFSKRGTFPMYIERSAIDALYQLFAQYRATPVLWVMDERYTRMQIFGFWKSIEFVSSEGEYDEYDIVTEGVT